MPTKKQEKLTKQTIKIIEAGGRIVLRRKDGWYLHQHTNIAAGPDQAVWGRKDTALEMFNLEWAHTIKRLYKCKVKVLFPKKNKVHIEAAHSHGDELCMGGHTCARQALK